MRIPIITLEDNIDDERERVLRVTVDYFHVRKIKSKDPETRLFSVTIQYKERMIIDYESETIEYIRRLGSGCEVTQKLYVQDGIRELLEDIDVDELFGEVEGGSSDVSDNSSETRDYTITVDFKKRPQRVFQGVYDKTGLPKYWGDFAYNLWEFIHFYDSEEILNSNFIYRKLCYSKQDYDYIYCSVAFSEGGKTYYYRAREEDDIEVGDRVEVPVGEWGHETTATVMDVEYFLEDEVPLPVESTKYIIRKCEE